MKAVKKIDIVTDALSAKKVIELLHELDMPGYTLIKHVAGSGDQGEQDAEGLHSAFENWYILVACSMEEFARLKEPLRSLLSRSGGICLVSDAQWLLH